METKTNPIIDCEIKAHGSGWSFEGYGSKFDGVDSYNDTIHKGAYEKSLSDRDMQVFMRFEHRSGDLPPGKWTHIEEDSKGLFMKGELTKGQSLATDIKASMEHGTLQGLSIGYRIPKGGAEEIEGVRHIREIDLVEVSIVQNPADSAALITGMKGEIEVIESLKEAERFLRDVDKFSKSTAMYFVSRVKALCLRDAEKASVDEITELKNRLSHKDDANKLVNLINNLEL